MSDYYTGGFRVLVDGVPCRVSYIPRNAEFKARMAMVVAGEIEWEPMPELPMFSYTPSETRKAGKARSVAKVAVKCSKEARAYYGGGHRATLGGVPVRLARKVSQNAMRQMQQGARLIGVLSDAEIERRTKAFKRDKSDYRFAA